MFYILADFVWAWLRAEGRIQARSMYLSSSLHQGLPVPSSRGSDTVGTEWAQAQNHTSTFRVSAYFMPTDIPLAEASYMAKPNISGSWMYTLPTWEGRGQLGNEYLLNSNLIYHPYLNQNAVCLWGFIMDSPGHKLFSTCYTKKIVR